MILQGKVALVTGAHRNWSSNRDRIRCCWSKVVFSDIRSVEGEETADLIRETGAVLVREIRCIE